MKNYKKLALVTIIAATLPSVATANDTQTDSEVSKTGNEVLSNVRTQIKQQLLENELKDVVFQGLKKERDISDIENAIENDANGFSNDSLENINQEKVDLTYQMNQNINDEDILSEEQDLNQNVGFIYEDDLGVQGVNFVEKINETQNDEIDFEDMLEKVSNDVEEDISNKELNKGSSLIDLNEFKLINLELKKLIIYGDNKNVSLRVNYITNNGYQKIKGYKTFYNKKVGDIFNVKGEMSFEILEINDSGFKYKNVKNSEVKSITR